MGGEWREMGGTSWAEQMISRKLNEITISKITGVHHRRPQKNSVQSGTCALNHRRR